MPPDETNFIPLQITMTSQSGVISGRCNALESVQVMPDSDLAESYSLGRCHRFVPCLSNFFVHPNAISEPENKRVGAPEDRVVVGV